jgi:hypothetical protein
LIGRQYQLIDSQGEAVGACLILAFTDPDRNWTKKIKVKRSSASSSAGGAAEEIEEPFAATAAKSRQRRGGGLWDDASSDISDISSEEILLSTASAIIPLLSSLAAPVPSHIAPLLHLNALPEENTNMPLAPAVPTFVDRGVTLPLLAAVPLPETNDKAPPVFTMLRPEIISMLPPPPLVSLPAVNAMNLPGPLVAATQSSCTFKLNVLFVVSTESSMASRQQALDKDPTYSFQQLRIVGDVKDSAGLVHAALEKNLVESAPFSFICFEGAASYSLIKVEIQQLCTCNFFEAALFKTSLFVVCSDFTVYDWAVTSSAPRLFATSRNVSQLQ